MSSLLLIVLLALAGAVVLLLLWVAGAYNGLIRLRNQVENAWSQIDVQLKRRHDLIPNLVETVKGYAAHESKTLENVIKARNMAIGAKSVGERAEAENFLTGTLKSLFAVAEAYPNLKADQNFLRLQEEVTSTENKVAYSRQFYNDSVMTFNTRRELFPTNIIANMFNFGRREFFEVKDDAQREAPQVKFS
ncbi:MAG: LemA family protein [Verrucomicrobia bacterium]|nr:LemA family protein [Verrucomicrobiota bacterium]